MLTQDRLRELLHYDLHTGVFRWRVDRAGSAVAGSVAGSTHYKSGHVRISVDGRSYGAHRLAWLYQFGTWPNGMIDHINQDPADNRIANLRSVDSSTNQKNVTQRSERKEDLPTGVYRVRKKPSYKVEVTSNGKRIYLGVFTTIEEADATARHFRAMNGFTHRHGRDVTLSENTD